MILKVTSFLLVLTVSQVIADFVRPFELGARQLAACPEVNCTSIAPGCKRVSCVCNVEISKQVQDCVTCAVWWTENPSDDLKVKFLNVLDLYGRTCNGTPGLQMPTWPVGVGLPSTKSEVSSTPRQQPTSSGPGSDPTASLGGFVPIQTKNGAEKGRYAGFAVIGALLGVAVVL